MNGPFGVFHPMLKEVDLREFKTMSSGGFNSVEKWLEM
jgi:hypothetical protein